MTSPKSAEAARVLCDEWDRDSGDPDGPLLTDTLETRIAAAIDKAREDGLEKAARVCEYRAAMNCGTEAGREAAKCAAAIKSLRTGGA